MAEFWNPTRSQTAPSASGHAGGPVAPPASGYEPQRQLLAHSRSSRRGHGQPNNAQGTRPIRQEGFGGRLRRLSVTIACHRQGGGSAAEVLARSLDQTPNRTLLAMAPSAPASSPPCSALRDPSFSFVDALSVAAWGRPSASRVDRGPRRPSIRPGPAVKPQANAGRPLVPTMSPELGCQVTVDLRLVRGAGRMHACLRQRDSLQVVTGCPELATPCNGQLSNSGCISRLPRAS